MKKSCGCSRKGRKGNSGFFGGKTLLALLLFVFQFSNCGNYGYGQGSFDGRCGSPLIDNSILFIIALYFICCCTNDEGCF